MKNLWVIASVLLVSSFNLYSTVKYDPSTIKCPKPSSTDRYIAVPVIHDLKNIAVIENIPNLKLYNKLQEKYKGMELSVYYESINEFDNNKETVILIPGGPGENHTFIHQHVDEFKNKSDFFEKYNVVAMDHRGLGCSRPTFPGNEPAESLTMKFAAADIELIRQALNPNKKIHVWGYSYGSMLAQTYALLFPKSVNKLFLGGAFSAAEDFRQAKRDYEKLVATSTVGEQKYNIFMNDFPRFKKYFLDYTLNQMYSYEGRTRKIPEMLETVTILLQAQKFKEAKKLLSDDQTFIMPWMMRSISCIEIFNIPIDPHVYQMFGDLFKSCDEYSKIADPFNYTQSLSNLPMKTFIWGGKFDHVTPAKAMIKMAKIIPDNYLYIDQHIGHGYASKIDCFINFMDNFFSDNPKESLENIATSKTCTDEPKIKENTTEPIK